ncbi:hypothetical protein BaRGS_00019214 [Batillaria attramentaria]|uniref:Uncharacterized protein n=1 Tax=Batillaria attramentaria TaxID=370345 RepID=A0ABD0KS43_9CAEN
MKTTERLRNGTASLPGDHHAEFKENQPMVQPPSMKTITWENLNDTERVGQTAPDGHTQLYVTIPSCWKVSVLPASCLMTVNKTGSPQSLWRKGVDAPHDWSHGAGQHCE